VIEIKGLQNQYFLEILENFASFLGVFWGIRGLSMGEVIKNHDGRS